MTSPARLVNKIQKSSWQNILADTLTIFWGEWLDLRVMILQIAATGLISPLIIAGAHQFAHQQD